jgi:hypothetical protein
MRRLVMWLDVPKLITGFGRDPIGHLGRRARRWALPEPRLRPSGQRPIRRLGSAATAVAVATRILWNRLWREVVWRSLVADTMAFRLLARSARRSRSMARPPLNIHTVTMCTSTYSEFGPHE